MASPAKTSEHSADTSTLPLTQHNQPATTSQPTIHAPSQAPPPQIPIIPEIQLQQTQPQQPDTARGLLLPIQGLAEEPDNDNDLGNQLINKAEKETHVLFIPHFSDVGRINEMEEQQIVQQIADEMQGIDEQEQEQGTGRAAGRRDNNSKQTPASIISTPQDVKKEEVRTTKADLSPPNVNIPVEIIDVKKPKEEKLPEKEERRCCLLM